MNEDKYYIKISPENILGELTSVPYTAYSYTITGVTGTCCYITSISSETIFVTGTTVGYLPMSKVLSGGTNGTSLLTGLTIPILIRENAVDIGYYSVFDGAILQSDVVKNFVFSASTGTPYTYNIYNTSEKELKTFLQLSSYSIDWGDGINTAQTITTLSPSYISYQYLTSGKYTITLKQKTPWGTNIVKKRVVVPYTSTVISNPKGTAYFTPNIGSWSATPISYDFIFSGDAENLISKQTSNNYVSTPFIISGFTTSRINELRQYGANPFQLYVPITKNGQQFGIITTMSSTYTGYTIEGIQYLDFYDGTTVYLADSSGLTSNWMVQSAMTKNESLMNIVTDPEVQSDIFIERGKNSALERVERLGEVDNTGDLKNYGYGFFNFIDQNKI
jgi:hypothetical protein